MKALITGGAGFIGSNIAKRLQDRGDESILFDNLSRPGSRYNLEWLQAQGPIRFVRGDVRQFEELEQLLREHPDVDVVYHMASQVAVTRSVADPREDFNVNALGTLNVLEAIRLSRADPVLIFASTNKVYGGMEDVEIVEKNGRYTYRDYPDGIPEDRFLDFHSPYGCSKGAADQYVRDYSRLYGLKTVSFRQSCIYGHRQFGLEDQGWVAWFTIQAVLGRPVTIYGDGKQVRDMLFIDDLMDAYEAALHRIEVTNGKIYNVGGGPRNAMCLLELIASLEKLCGRNMDVEYRDWRPGDQPVFICDVKKSKQEFGWEPHTSPEQGVESLYTWIEENREVFLRKEP